MTKVKCRCGATELEITAKPIVQFFCHCDDCQAVHGGAYAPESVYPADAVKVVRGDPMAWKLKRNPRFTCPECGTRLFIDVLGRDLRGVNGFLLPPGEFQPAFHVQCQFAIRPVVDELPHYKGMPASFGGSDEKVGWRLPPQRPRLVIPAKAGIQYWRTSPVEFRIRGNDKTAGCDLSESEALRTYTRSARRFGSGPD